MRARITASFARLGALRPAFVDAAAAKLPAPLRRRMSRRFVIKFSVVAGSALALSLIFTVVTDQGALASLSGGGAGAAMAASGVAYFSWYRRLGKFTAVVALSLIWALCVLAVLVTTPHCGAAVGGRCSASESGQWMLIGFLIPVLPAAVAFPGYALYRVVRAVWRASHRVRSGGPLLPRRQPPTGAPARPKPGRVTPKGTRPTTGRRRRR